MRHFSKEDIELAKWRCKSKQPHTTLVRKVITEKSANDKCWRGCGEKRTLPRPPPTLHWWQCTLVHPLWRTVLRFLLCSVAQSCPSLRNPIDCSPPSSSVHGISQVRILKWVTIFFSRNLPDPGSIAHCRQILYLRHLGNPMNVSLKIKYRAIINSCSPTLEHLSREKPGLKGHES